ncbi:chymotrypsin-C-like [Spinachia spinachia]
MTYFVPTYGCGRPTFPPVLIRVAGEDARPHSSPWQGRAALNGLTVATAQRQDETTPAFTRSDIPQRGKHSLKTSEEGSMARMADTIIPHQYYNILLSRNDIALIELSSSSPSPTPRFSPAALRLTSCSRLTARLLERPGHRQGGGGDGIAATGVPTPLHPAEQTQGKGKCARACACGPAERPPDGSWVVHGPVSFGSGEGCNILQKLTVFTRLPHKPTGSTQP